MIYKMRVKKYVDGSISILGHAKTNYTLGPKPGGEPFRVDEDNKIWVNDYDAFNEDQMKLINAFNNMHVVDRSLHLWDLTNALRRK